MARHITEADLERETRQIVDALLRGETFVLMEDGRPLGELVLRYPRTFVRTEEAQEAFSGLPRIDAKKFREDIDAILDQDPTPRG